MSFIVRTALGAVAILGCSGPVTAAPVTLTDALARSQSSPRLAAARALVDAAQARARQAGLSPNPELGLTVENFAGTGVYRGLRATETTLEFSQRIELGGKRSARVRVLRAEVEAARLTVVRAQADLDRDIREAHATLLAAQARVQVAADNVSRGRELLRVTALLVDTGRDPPLRKLRAEALLADAVAARAEAQGEVVAAQRALAALTGDDGIDVLAIEGPVEPAPAVAPTDESLEERLAIAERDVILARIDQARSEGVPDPTVGGGIRRLQESGDVALVARVSMPLPIRNRNTGDIAAARADALAAEANLAQIRRDSVRARGDALTRLTIADARLAALGGAGQAQAEEAVRIARLGYQAGKFSLIELIDAQTALNAQRRALIDARLDRSRAIAALIRATAREGE